MIVCTEMAPLEPRTKEPASSASPIAGGSSLAPYCNQFSPLNLAELAIERSWLLELRNFLVDLRLVDAVFPLPRRVSPRSPLPHRLLIACRYRQRRPRARAHFPSRLDGQSALSSERIVVSDRPYAAALVRKPYRCDSRSRHVTALSKGQHMTVRALQALQWLMNW